MVSGRKRLLITGPREVALTPPPVALERALSFQTFSLAITPPEPTSRVPPQLRAKGLEAGKSTWSPPSRTPSEEPLSPAATQTVTPSAAASANAE